MSSNIENRIVQMQFENSRFESGIKESLKSLEKLKEELKLDDATKSLEGLQKAGDSFSLAKIADGIESLSNRFSAFGIMGMRVLENLTDKAMAFVGKLTGGLKDLSIGQIDPGFGKYEDKTRAVQTIMSATGESMETIDEQLAKLNWFTDETSYNFVDMVGNIGKFTSVGVKLEPAVTAMQGIATWAADSGAGISEASRAMYNLSQAMGAGAVKKIDWKSIENANMATAKFKENVIQTAIALGKLDKNGKTKKGGTLVTVENFAETLQKGWFDKDVLVKVLERYGSFADEVYAYTEKYGVSASEAIEALSGQFEQFSEDAFKAAQEAKTFTDAMDATKDAVSSGFMQMFENIFGNYEEAKVIWTKLANDMWEIFAAPLESVNELLHEWRGYREVIDRVTGEATGEEEYNRMLDGRIYIVNGLSDAFDGLLNVISAVKEVFSNIFPQTTADQLLSFSKRVEELGHRFKILTEGFDRSSGQFEEKVTKVRVNPLEDFDEELKRGARGEGVKTLQQRLKQLGFDIGQAGVDGIFGPATEKALKEFQKKYGLAVTGVYDELTHTRLGEGVGLTDYIVEMTESVEDIQHVDFNQFATFKTILGGVFAAAHIVAGAFSALGSVVGHIVGLLKPLGDAFILIAEYIGQALINVDKWINENEIFGDWIARAQKFFEPFGQWVKEAADALLAFFGIGDHISGSQKDLITFASIYESIKKSLDESGVIQRVIDAFNNLKKTFKTIKTTIESTWKTTKASLGNGITKVLSAIPGIVSTVLVALGSFASFILEKFSSVISKIPSIVSAIKDFFSALTFKGDASLGKGPGILAKAQGFYDKVKGFLFGTKDTGGNVTKVGALTRVGNLLKGDIDGFTEGLPEKEALEIKEKLEAIKGYIEDAQAVLSQIVSALSRLITGEGGEDTLNESTIGKIDEYRNTIKDVFISIGQFFTDIYDGIRLLITGDVSNTSLSSDGVAGLLKARSAIANFFNIVRYMFTGDRGEYNSNWVDDETAGRIDAIRSGIVGVLGKIGNFFVSIYEAVRILITGNLSENSVFEDGGQRVLDFRNSIARFFEKVKYLFTGKGGDELYDSELDGLDDIRNGAIGIINSVVDFFKKVVEAVRILITGDLSDNSVFADGGQGVLNFRNGLFQFFAKVKYLFTGKGGDELDDSDLDKLDNIRGIFTSIINSVADFFKKVAEAAYILITGNVPDESVLGDASDTILSFRNGIKNLFTAVKRLFTGEGGDDSLSEDIISVIDGFRSMVSTVAGHIIDAVSTAWKFVSSGEIIDKVRGFFVRIYEFVKLVATGNFEDTKLTGKDFVAALNVRVSIINFIKGFKSFISSVKEAFSGLDFSSVGAFLASAWEGIKTLFSTLSDGAKGLIKWGGIAALIISVCFMIGNISGAFQKLKGAIDGFKGNKVRPLSTSIMMIAGAIAIIAASIAGLGALPEDMLNRGLASVGGIFLALTLFIALTAKFLKKDQAKMISSIGKTLLNVAISLGILALTVAALSVIPIKNFYTGVLRAVILLGTLSLLLLAIKKMKLESVKLSGIWQLAVVIGAMALVVGILGKMKPETVVQGELALLGIVAILSGLMIAIGFASKISKGKLKPKGLIGLAVLIGVMAIVVGALGNMKRNKLIQGGIAVAAMMGLIIGLVAVLGIFGNTMPSTGPILSIFLGLTAVIVSFGIILNLIKGVDPKLLYAFSISLGIALGAFVAACLVVGKMEGGSSSMVKGAIAIGLASIILGSIVGGFIGIVGWLDQLTNGGISSAIESGGKVLEAIGNALSGLKEAVGLNTLEITLLIGACAILGKLGIDPVTMASGAAGLGAAFAVIIALVGGLTAILGKIDEWTNGGLIDALQRGGEVLGEIGNAIGSLVGGIGAGFANQQSEAEKKTMTDFAEAFEQIGAAVAGMATNTTFEDDLNAALTQAQALHDWFEKLTPYEINDSLTGPFVAYATAASSLSTDMGLFAEGIQAFKDHVLGFASYTTAEEDRKAAVGIAEQLYNFFSDLKAYKVYGNPFTGNYYTAPGQLSTDMGNFATAIGLFAVNVKKIQTKEGEESIEVLTEKAIAITKKIKEFFDSVASSSPESEGLISYNEAISSLFIHVQEMGKTIADYNTEISGIAGSTITTDTDVALRVMDSIAQFLNDVKTKYESIEENKGALDKWFNGDTTANTVIDSVGRIGEGLGKLNTEALKGLSSGTFLRDFSVGIDAFKKMTEFLVLFGDNWQFSIPDSRMATLDIFNGWIEKIAQKIREFAEQVKDIEDLGIITNLMSSLTSVLTVISGGGDISVTTDNFLGGVLQISKDVLTELNNSITEYETVGYNIVQGITDGINNNRSKAISAAATMAAAAFVAACKVLGVQSPSKEFAWIGEMSDEGLAKGLIQNSGMTEKASETVTNGMLETAQGSLASLSSLLAEGIDDQPVIRPIVDLTGARDAANSIGSFFGNQSFGVTSNVMAKRTEMSGDGNPVTIQNGTVQATMAADAMNNQMRTLNESINSLKETGIAADQMQSLTDRFGDLAEAVSNMQIVLDTGVLVGSIGPQMDSQLGVISMRRGRGN